MVRSLCSPNTAKRRTGGPLSRLPLLAVLCVLALGSRVPRSGGNTPHCSGYVTWDTVCIEMCRLNITMYMLNKTSLFCGDPKIILKVLKQFCSEATCWTVFLSTLTSDTSMCHCNSQTLQEVAMLRSHQFTQIQRFPANSVRRCNFNTSPQLSRKFDKSLSSPTTFSLPRLHQGRKFCPADTVQTLAVRICCKQWEWLHQTWKPMSSENSEIDLASIFIIFREVCVALFT